MKGFVTRAQAGLVRPRSFSRNITPQRGGCAIHWGGPNQKLGAHSRCLEVWRSWQRYHMKKHNWVDIAYTLGFCIHGYAFAGRGFNVRTAAQGTTDGNNRFYAIVFIGGEGDTVTVDAINAMRWCINEARTKGNAGLEVRRHSEFTDTSCPGVVLGREAARLHNKPIPKPTPVPPPKPEPEPEPKDWFTMATEEDLKRIVRAEIESALDNRSYGADMGRVRRSLRAVAAEAGLETEHAVPDGYKVEA